LSEGIKEFSPGGPESQSDKKIGAEKMNMLTKLFLNG
jgi:hypothetical protein